MKAQVADLSVPVLELSGIESAINHVMVSAWSQMMEFQLLLSSVF